MILSLEQVCVDYGTGPSAFRAVHDVTLTITEGTVLGLVGESGSGKSTLGRAIAGLEPVSSGVLDTSRLPTRDRRYPVQYIFQDASSALNPRMTIGRIIAEGVGPAAKNRKQLQQVVDDLMNQVHLDPTTATKRPSQLSGGQRQRVAIARALAVNPAVLVAVEITSALDASVHATVLIILWQLKQRRDSTMIFISHDLFVAHFLSIQFADIPAGCVAAPAAGGRPHRGRGAGRSGSMLWPAGAGEAVHPGHLKIEQAQREGRADRMRSCEGRQRRRAAGDF